jgi:type II secretory pathway predicted ATPase ExeA
MDYRKRFGLKHHPLPKDVQGKSFFEDSPGYRDLSRAFVRLSEDRGLGLLTGPPGAGKTAAIRNLCHALPAPEHRVLYLCDTAVAPLDLYRMLAIELGVTPSHRRSQLWHDIKKTLLHVVDEQGVVPVVVIDEAQHLSDRFLVDLGGFLNFTFDSRDLLAMWLVGMPPLLRHLRMQQHAALAMRVQVHVHVEPLGRADFTALVEHAMRAAGATERLLSEPAMEILFRSSRGLPRVASKILRAVLRLGADKNQSFIDEHTMQAAISELSFAADAPEGRKEHATP